MIVPILSLTTLGLAFGLILGLAARFFRVEGNPLVEELEALLPGSFENLSAKFSPLLRPCATQSFNTRLRFCRSKSQKRRSVEGSE